MIQTKEIPTVFYMAMLKNWVDHLRQHGKLDTQDYTPTGSHFVFLNFI
jgi:hypothetical protein